MANYTKKKCPKTGKITVVRNRPQPKKTPKKAAPKAAPKKDDK